MTGYTASNGAIIHRTPDGKLALGNYSQLDALEEQAWREFFQHERDEELGRWRWPENPDYVVYPDEDGDVIVLDEATGRASSPVIRSELTQWNPSHGTTKAARAYFEAHPERKPWEDAQPGEAWVFTINGEEFAGVLDMDREFRRLCDGDRWTHVNDSDITAGRRIWPEGDAS